MMFLIFHALILFPIALLWCLWYWGIHKKRYWVTPFCILFFTLMIHCLCSLAASIRANYHGQTEWKKSRNFFYSLFLEDLEKSGNIRESAARMTTDDVKKQGLQLIKDTVKPFYAKGNLPAVAGAFLLLIAIILPFLRKYRGHGSYPWCFFAAFLAGLALLAPGIFWREYAAKSQKYLSHILQNQQEEMQELCQNPPTEDTGKVLRFTRNYLAENEVGYDRGHLFLHKLRKSLK